ncbi:MAG: phosphomethylpyrimidine synthase ThiC [Pseudomonadota bacterium]
MRIDHGTERPRLMTSCSGTFLATIPDELGKRGVCFDMTQIEAAGKGIITDEMKVVGEREGLSPEYIRKGIYRGKIAVIYDRRRPLSPVGIGPGLKIKVNANIGTSCDRCDPGFEVKKAREAEKWGADTLMDLSTFGDISAIRADVIRSVSIPVGAVPVYQAATEAKEKYGTHLSMKESDLFQIVTAAILEGCSMLTLHCGIEKRIVRKLSGSRRVMKMTSRGGGILASWMQANDSENPLFKRFDDLLEMARSFDTALSLGASCRAGCIEDGADDIHTDELVNLGKLAKRARKAGVQVKIEGPGHLAVHMIGPFIKKAKRLIKGAPLGIMGPIVTDIAPGYDHITLAIGATVALLNGADYICTVYPSEHLGLPELEDIRPGILAARIAAHAADIARRPADNEWDHRMAFARASLDWSTQFKEAIDSRTAKSIKERTPSKAETCSVCGDLCPHKLFGKSK